MLGKQMGWLGPVVDTFPVPNEILRSWRVKMAERLHLLQGCAGMHRDFRSKKHLSFLKRE